MTQPPDERRPGQPGDEGGPEDEPTIAWTPPESEPEAERRPEAPDEGGVGYAAIPDEGASQPAGSPPAPPAPNMPTEPPAPPPAEPPPTPTGPIISATPAEPTPTPPPPAQGWQTPAAPTPPPPPAAAPTAGLDVPAPAAPAPTQTGDVIATTPARLVAWLIDYTLAGVIPGLIGLALIVPAGFIQRIAEAAAQDPTGRNLDPNAFVLPTTLDFVLANLIGTAVLYLYFVFFWTSRWRGTPGMIGLKMRVVDVMSGGEISLLQATKRWLAFGYWLPLLGFLPGLQSSAGLIQAGLWIFLLFTTATNARRQGVQDRWANTLVIRSATSRDGATFAGCLVWGVMVILITVIIWVFIVAAAGPAIQEYFESMPSPAI